MADAIVAMVDGLAIRMMLEPGDWRLARVEAVLMAVTPMFLVVKED